MDIVGLTLQVDMSGPTVSHSVPNKAGRVVALCKEHWVIYSTKGTTSPTKVWIAAR